MSSLSAANTKLSSNQAGLSFTDLQLDALTARLSPFVMEHIFGYLTGTTLQPHADLVVCNRVCKTWYKLSNSNYLWELIYTYRFGSEDSALPLNKFMSAVARNNKLQEFAPQNSAFIANSEQAAQDEAVAYKPKTSKFNHKKYYMERSQFESMVIDIKPLDTGVKMEEIETQIRSIVIGPNGRDVKWMKAEIKPLCYGLKYLVFEAHISKIVTFEQIEEAIMALEGCRDKISSVDLKSIRKLRYKTTTVIKPKGFDSGSKSASATSSLTDKMQSMTV